MSFICYYLWNISVCSILKLFMEIIVNFHSLLIVNRMMPSLLWFAAAFLDNCRNCAKYVFLLKSIFIELELTFWRPYCYWLIARNHSGNIVHILVILCRTFSQVIFVVKCLQRPLPWVTLKPNIIILRFTFLLLNENWLYKTN